MFNINARYELVFPIYRPISAILYEKNPPDMIPISNI